MLELRRLSANQSLSKWRPHLASSVPCSPALTISLTDWIAQLDDVLDLTSRIHAGKRVTRQADHQD